MTNGRIRKIFFKFLKIIGWTVLSIVLLLVMISLAIQIPAIQNKITQKAISFLEGKIKTEVRLEHISIGFPKKIVLDGLYLEDQKKDTLLYAGKLSVDTDLWALTNHTIQLNDVEFEMLRGYISRSRRDSAFNFDYIVKAFTDTTSTDVPEDTTAQPWNFSVGDVALNNVRFGFKDPIGGNDLDLKLGTLEIDVDEFDLSQSVIKVDDITLSDVIVSFEQSDVPIGKQIQDSVQTADEPFPYDLGFATVDLKNIKADYVHHGSGQIIRVDLHEGTVEANNFDLRNQIIDLDKLSLNDAFVLFHQLKKKEATPEQTAITQQTTGNSKSWQIALGNLELKQDVIQYYDFNKPMLAEGIDFSHLWISDLSAEASDLRWDGVNASGAFEKLNFHDRSGFAVTDFQSDFAMDVKSVQLKEFILHTPNSSILLSARIEGDSISTLGKNYPDAKVTMSIKPSVISFRDIAYFSPAVLSQVPIKLPVHERIAFSGSAEGKINDLEISSIDVSALSKTSISAAGHLKGLPDIRNTYMDVNLKKLYTTKKDLVAVLPDTIIPKSIAIPQWINIAGNFKGTMTKPAAKANLTSDYGKISVDAKMNLDSTITKENYKAAVDVEMFQLGKLLMQEKTIGVLDLQASINGAGLKLDNLEALMNVDVNDFEYNGYHYKNFNIDGSMKKYFFSGEAKLDDKNLDFKLTGDLDYNGDTPHYNLKFDLKNADFNALNLSERPLKARLKLDVDLETKDFKTINGSLDIRNVAVFNGKSLYAVDSLLFASLDQEGRSELSIRSDILSGDFKGTLNLYSLPDAIRRHFNNYFSLRDSTYDKPIAPQNFEFELTLKNTDLLTEILVPDLEPFIPGKISGLFDSELDQLDLEFGITRVKYGGIGVDSINLKINSDKDDLQYFFGVRNVVMDTMHIEALRIFGNVSHDSIRTKFTVVDTEKRDKYIIGGVINSFEDTFKFRLLASELTLNYEDWDTPVDNYMMFGSKGIVTHNFQVRRGEESVSLVRAEDRDSTLSVIFKKFDLANLTHFIEGTTPAAGFMDGDVNLSVAESGAFNSFLTVHHLNILEQSWGDLVLQLGKTSSGPFNIDLRVEGENAILKAAGYLETKDDQSVIHFETSIDKLNLAIAEPLSFGQLKNVNGQLIGKISVDGSTKDPDINGEITFKQANFIAAKVNSEFTLEDETIKINKSGLSFKDFEILDAKKNTASIRGDISAKGSFSEFDLGLRITTRQFQLLNSTVEDNDLFFGKVGLNMRADITGTTNLPRINMIASLTKDSEFTYVVPQSEKGILEQQGIVVFVDRDAKKDPFLANINPQDTSTSSFRGIELTANIELTEFETFNIIIDPITGDKLSVKGNSTLTLDMDASGDMDLSGRYEVVQGSYDMSFYKLVKRKFNIEKGGTITWSGDPLNALMDLRASYLVETSPIELVEPQSNSAVDERYRQQLPFLVFLNIKGELLTPEISFQLDMPERERQAFGGSIYAILQDLNTRESDLNKQVFALLILKRFISDNPFDSQGGDVEATARRSVSKLLTEQLNRLSQNVKGLELSVDVKSYEDFSSGSAQGQTELQLGVSKSLLNDRLVVKVSGNVDVEGDASQQSTFADYIGDLALEYKLTPDGRFRITGFRNSNYDMIDGELIETGAGLIYIKDYNTLRELFRANVKQN